jgi:hypothetical protein
MKLDQPTAAVAAEEPILLARRIFPSPAPVDDWRRPPTYRRPRLDHRVSAGQTPEALAWLALSLSSLAALILSLGL